MSEIIVDMKVNETQAVEGVERVADAFSSFNAEVQDSISVFNAYTTAMQEMSQGTVDLLDAASASSTILEQWAERFGRINTTALDAAAGLDAITESAANTGSEESISQMFSFEEAVRTLEESAQEGIGIFQEFAENIGLPEEIMGGFETASTFVSDFAQKTVDAKDQIVEVAGGVDTLGDSFSQFLQGDTLSNVETFKTRITNVEGAAVGLLGQVKELGSQVGLSPKLLSNFDTASQFVSNFTGKTVEIVGTIDNLNTSSGNALNAVKGLFSGDTFTNAENFSAAVTDAETATTVLLEDLQTLAQQSGLPPEVVNAFGTLKDHVGDFSGQAVKAYGHVQDIAGASKEVVSGFKDVFSKETYANTEALAGAIGKIGTNATSVIENTKALGEQLGLPQEVLDGFTAAQDLIGGFTDTSTTVITSFGNIKDQGIAVAGSLKNLFSRDGFNAENLASSFDKIKLAAGSALESFKTAWGALGLDPGTLAGIERIGGLISNAAEEGKKAGQVFGQYTKQLQSMLKTISQQLGPLGQKISGMLQKLGPKISGIGNALQKMSGKFGSNLSGVFGKLGGFIGKFGPKIGGLGNKIGGMLGKLGSKLGGLASKLAGVGGLAVQAFSFGWGIGRAISGLLGLDSKMEETFSNALDGLGLLAKKKENLFNEEQKNRNDANSNLRQSAKELGILSNSRNQLLIEMQLNKEYHDRQTEAVQRSSAMYVKKNNINIEAIKLYREEKKELKNLALTYHTSTKAIENLGASYGIYLGDQLKKVRVQQNTMLALWDKSEGKILGNADSTQKYLEDMKGLSKILGDQASPKMKEIIKLLEEQNKKYQKTKSINEYAKAIENYSRSLGFVSKSKVAEEMNLMTASLKKYADQYKNNPEMLESLLKKIDALKIKAKQSNLPFSKELLDIEKGLKVTNTQYKESKKQVINFGFGIMFTVEQLEQMKKKQKELAAEQKKAREALKNYGKGLGILDKEDVEKEMEMFGKLFQEQGWQIETNPELLDGFTKRLEKLNKQAKQTKAELPQGFIKAQKGIEDLNKGIDKTKNKSKELEAAFEKALKTIATGKKILGGFKSIVTSLAGELDNTTKSLFGVAEAGLKMADSAASFGVASLKGDIGGMVDGAVGFVGGLVDGFTSFLSLFDTKIDWGARAARQLKGLPGVTQEMREELAELAEEVGNVREAYVQLMSDFISEGVTSVTSFKIWAREITENLDFPWTMSPADQQKHLSNLNKAFEELVTKADKFKQHGSAAMVEIINQTRELTGPYKEIMGAVSEYVTEQLTKGLEGLTGYVSDASDLLDQLAEKRTDMEKLEGQNGKVKRENQEEYDRLKEEIDDLQTAFDKLMSQEKFDRAAEYAIGYMGALMAEGKSMMEVIELMGDQLDDLINIADSAGYDKGILTELLGMREFVNNNKSVLTQLEGLKTMMDGFANAGRLDQNMFTTMQEDAVDMFNSMEGEAKEKLEAIAPMLARMVWLSKEHKLALDDGTAALVDQAIQAGINMDTMLPPQEKMVALLEELVVLFGGEVPYAIKQAAEAAKEAAGGAVDETRKWGNELKNIEDQFNKGLTTAVSAFDESYQEHLTGNTIVKETIVWSGSLKEVQDQIENDLPKVVAKLDEKYTSNIGNVVVKTEIWSESLDDVEEQVQENIPKATEDMDAQFDKSVEKIRTHFKKMLDDSKKIPGSLEDIQKGIIAATGSFELAEKAVLHFGFQLDNELQQKINDLATELGSLSAAESKYMADIIKGAQINVNNFDLFVNRTRKILDDLQSGSLTIEETQESMGSAFTALLKEAQDLGTEGSRSMLNLLRDVRDVGLEIQEIKDYVDSKLSSGTKALGNFTGTFVNMGELDSQINELEKQKADIEKLIAGGTLSADEKKNKSAEAAELGEDIAQLNEDFNAAAADVRKNWDLMQTSAIATFSALGQQGYSVMERVMMMKEPLAELAIMGKHAGVEVNEGFQGILDMANFMEEHETLATRIESTRAMMEALGDAALLDQKAFTTFAQSATSQFNDVMDATQNEELALRMVAPQLENLIKYSESYGYRIDDETQKLIEKARAQGVLAEETQSDAEITNQLLTAIAEALNANIPDSIKKTTKVAEDSMKKVQMETNVWKDGLHDVEDQLKTDVPAAVEELDKKYSKAMTGNTIVKETLKWKYSLEDVQEILGKELPMTAEELDRKYKHVQGNVSDYLKETSTEGFKANLTFDQMVGRLTELQAAYGQLAAKRKLNDYNRAQLDDYERQIGNLKKAIEETAPTLENFEKHFEELQETLNGNIGVNAGMIQMARNLREQGQTLEDIDSIIEKSLENGSKGIGNWINALGPATDQIEEIKNLNEEIESLLSMDSLSDEETEKLAELEDQLKSLTATARSSMWTDTQAILNSQDMMTTYFYSLQAEGKDLFEIMELLGDGFQSLANKSVDGSIVPPLSETFNELYQLEQKMSENGTLIEGIQGLSSALHGIGDSMVYMSRDSFGTFEQASVQAFEKLTAAGFRNKEALQVMAPILRDLGAYAAEYGYVLSDPVARMLDDAEKAKMIREEQKSDTERLIDANVRLADTIDRMTGAFAQMQGLDPFGAMEQQAYRLSGSLGAMRNEMVWMVDENGIPVNLSSPWTEEDVRRFQATPVSRMNLSDSSSTRGGDIVFEHVTIQGENGDECVREFMDAIKGNRYGVQNLIRKVAN